MGIEQKPQPLEKLRSLGDRFDRAAFNIDAMIKDPGGERWPQRLNLNGIADSERYLETAVRVGEITERLKIQTQPIIERERKAIYFEIEDRIFQAEKNVERIAELADQGIFGARAEEILERAQEALRNLRGENSQIEVQPEVTDKGVHTEFILIEGLINRKPCEHKSELDEAFLLGVEQYLQGHPAPYNMNDLARVTGRHQSSISTNKSLKEDAKSLGIELIRGSGRENRFSAEELRQLAIKIGSPNPRMFQAAKKERRERQEIATKKPKAIIESGDDRKKLGERIQNYIAANPQYFYSSRDLYRVTGRSASSLEAKQLEEVMQRHGIVAGKTRTHKYKIPPDKFIAIALDIGFPRISQPHTPRTKGRPRKENAPASTGEEEEIEPRIEPAETDRLQGDGLGPQTIWEPQQDIAETLKQEGIRQGLKIDLTKMLLSHLLNAHVANLSIKLSMTKDPEKLLATHLPYDTSLASITGANSAEELKKFIIDLFIEGVEEYWDNTVGELEKKGRIVSVKERQIIDCCQALKIIKSESIRSLVIKICRHFSIPIPNKFKSTPIK